MGVFGTLKDIFNPSSGIARAGGKLFDGASKALDAVHYSEEEKDAFKKSMSDSWLRLQNIIANESSPSALSRRFLAFATMGVFFSLVVLMAGWFPIEIYLVHSYKPALMATETLHGLLDNFDSFMLRYAPVTFFYVTLIKQIYTLVLMVMGTYFFYHGITRMRKGK